MNRRTFITGSAAAVAFAPLLGRVSAQDTSPEARWDDASQMYGNAWDLLPKAAEGKIEMVSLVSLGIGDNGGSKILGLIHNNTNDEQGLIDMEPKGSDWISSPQPYQFIIKPKGYAILKVSTQTGFEAGDVLPSYDPVFGSPDKVEESYIYYKDVPLHIDSVVFEESGSASVSLTNTGNTSIEGGNLNALIIGFDEHGLPLQGYETSGYDDLDAGPSYEDELAFNFVDWDPSAPYLVAYRAGMD